MVMREAIAAGADLINDINAFRADGALEAVALKGEGGDTGAAGAEGGDVGGEAGPEGSDGPHACDDDAVGHGGG